MHIHALPIEHRTGLKTKLLRGSSGHRLCRLGEPNLHVSIVEDGVVGSHEYVAQDPATPVLIVRVEDSKFLERLLSVLMMQNYFCFFGEEA
jgi:hypothetical protein